MKKIIVLFAFLIAISYTYAENGWMQYDGYSEINYLTDNINSLKLSLDGKYLYAVSGSKKVIKIDVETGDTVKTWKTKYAISDLNIEGESYLTTEEGTSFPLVKKIKLNTDSIEFTISVDYTDPYVGHMGGCGFNQCKVKISNNFQSFIALESFHCLAGGYIDDEYTGQIVLYDINTGNKMYTVNGWTEPTTAIFGMNNHIAYTSSHFVSYYRNTVPPYSSYNNDISLDSNVKINLKGGLASDENADNLSFSSNDEILLGTGSSKFNLWDVITGNLIKSYIPQAYDDYTSQFYFLHWSGNSNIFINSYTITNKIEIARKKSVMLFYHKDLTNPVDSIVFYDAEQNYFYCNGPDSTSFFTISQNKVIRWFKPKILSTDINAFFVSNKNILLPGLPVQFLDASTGNPDSWLWDFGDGTFSTEQNPVHSYSNPGIYDIKLVVSKGERKDSVIKTKYIVVNPSLKADFDVDITSGDYPLIVQFNNKSIGDITSYSWYFGDGKTDTVRNPIHIFTGPGVYPVSIVVKDSVFSDTLLIKDMIVVNYKTVSDTCLDREIYIPLQYTDILGTSAFDVTDGYYAEGYDNNNTTIIKLNELLEPVTSRIFYTNSFHRKMQKSTNGIYYFIGDTVAHSSKMILNQFSSLNNIKSFYTIDFHSYLQSYNYLVNSNKVLQSYIYSPNSMFYNDILDNNGNKKCAFSEFLWAHNYIYFTSLVISPISDSGWVVAYTARYSDNEIGMGDTIEEYCMFFNTYYSNGSYGWFPGFVSEGEHYGKIYDINYINLYSLLFIQYNTLYLYDTSRTRKPLFHDNYTLLFSIKVLSPNKILITGSKSGYCWYAFLDNSGNIKDEHIITERPGCFYTSNVNADNSLLFSGILKKNYTEKYLYLYKTNIMNDSIEKVDKLIQNDKITLYPNPANDEIILKGYNLKPEDINLFNCYGETIYLPDNIFSDSDKLRINLNTLSSGMYFVRIQTGRESIIEKFTVIK